MMVGSEAMVRVEAEATRGVQTFAAVEDRRRLSAAGLKAFRRVVERWTLDNVEAAGLLGVSPSTWDRIKAGRWGDNALSQDQLTRVSAVLGVFKGLNLLFVDAMADRWPMLPNKAPLFQRRTPVAAMIEGGIPRMLETRQYVDALRGGL